MAKQKPTAPPEPLIPDGGEENSLTNENQAKEGFNDEGVRAWYKRLAQEYRDNEPIVPDCGGGVSGDLYEL